MSNEIYLEHKMLPKRWQWPVLVFFCFLVLAYGMWVMMMVPDAPRYWDFGQFPDTPAESVYSTVEPSAKMPLYRVIPPLPEAKPLEPEPGKEGGA